MEHNSFTQQTTETLGQESGVVKISTECQASVAVLLALYDFVVCIYNFIVIVESDSGDTLNFFAGYQYFHLQHS